MSHFLVPSVFMSALSLTALCGPVDAQSAPTTSQPAEAPAMVVTLAPIGFVVGPTEAFPVELTIEVERDATCLPTLLSGYDFEVFVGNDKVGDLSKPVSGSLALVAGTTIRRRIELPIASVIGSDDSALRVVTVRWRGRPQCEAQVRVVPDQSSIDVAKLDLSKTEVTLFTNYGSMRVSFFPEQAPKHVESFVTLSKNGYYNSTKFHRIIEGFMIQGGCPNTKPGATGRPGTGNPGYMLPAEFSDIKHVRGILSAARSNDVNSAGSQFFVMHGVAAHLDGKYTVFGKLESGADILDTIATVPLQRNQRGISTSDPVDPVHLFAAIVHVP